MHQKFGIRDAGEKWYSFIQMTGDIVQCFQLGDDGRNQFEEMAKENGDRYWYARDFMVMLGYDKFQTFENAVQKAIRACTSLGIPLQGVINPIEREIEGQMQRDYKLSRFGCYLVAVNGDVRKQEVASAQAYFITLAEAFRQYVQKAESVERMLIRSDISERENSLKGVAFAAGVENFAYFQNAGYRGMYDMDLWKIRSIKGIPATRSPLDFMGKQEMAANLFRLTETEAKIKNEDVQGQRRLEQTAEAVGRRVRTTMMELSGTRPEYLPVATDIKQVQSGLKKTQKEFGKLDGKKKRALPKARTPKQLPSPTDDLFQ
ncbi:MAG: BRO family protein [Candidatus Sulfotelmatobacter sp.]